jgi:hypothetical protein
MQKNSKITLPVEHYNCMVPKDIKEKIKLSAARSDFLILPQT